MAIVKWEPYEELVTFHDRMNHQFQEPFRSFFGEGKARPGQDWIPAVDIYEDEDTIKLNVELPGMELKDIGVKVEKDTLNISGEKKLESDEKKEHYRQIETVSGRFVRSYTLPGTVDREKINAEYNKGILSVALPKREETRPRSIDIKVR